MGFSAGIVGLPNVGKSTLFKALTKKSVDISNYPFCTIDPNVGVVKVPDERLEKLAKFSRSKKIVPTAIEFVDIAGLVKNAHQGEGLGNKFLANIREVDMIVQVVRGFESGKITHVNNKVDPLADIETINLELILADLNTVNNALEKNSRGVKANDKLAIKSEGILLKYKEALEKEQLASAVEIDKSDWENNPDFLGMTIAKQLLTNKPMLYVVNVSENKELGYQRSKLNSLSNVLFLPIKMEAELSELSEEEIALLRKEYIGGTDKINKADGEYEAATLDELIKKCYQLLNLITFLTTGRDETRAWTIKKNSTAPQAGRAIHSDFEEKFIRANVINWRDLINAGSLQGAAEKGLLRTEGKSYIVKDGDVIEFRI